MEALNTGSAFRDPARPARKKAGGKKGQFCAWRTLSRMSRIVTLSFKLSRAFCFIDWLAELIKCCRYFSARPVDLRRSRTRTNIPVQKILEAQNAIDQQHNVVDIKIDEDDNQPAAPVRRKKDAKRGGEKTEEELEDEAQDILERLKKLWSLRDSCVASSIVQPLITMATTTPQQQQR